MGTCPEGIIPGFHFSRYSMDNYQLYSCIFSKMEVRGLQEEGHFIHGG